MKKTYDEHLNEELAPLRDFLQAHVAFEVNLGDVYRAHNPGAYEESKLKYELEQKDD